MPADANPPDTALGQAVFQTRCSICHGPQADGKSRLSGVMRPQPSNLRTSALDAEAMQRIIATGGVGVGRSDQMPPWGDELSGMEIDAIVAYLQGLKARR